MKKHYFLTFLFVLLFYTLNAQDKRWSVGVNYPFSVGDTFGSSNQGTIGGGIQYRFANLGNFRIGTSLDFAWFSTTLVNDSDPIQEQNYRDIFLQPKFFAELPLDPNNRFRLVGGIGWTWWNSRGGPAFFDNQGRIQGGEEWYNGFNLNLGFSYDISSRFFLHSQYDLIILSGDSPNSTAGLVKVGAGFRF